MVHLGSCHTVLRKWKAATQIGQNSSTQPSAIFTVRQSPLPAMEKRRVLRHKRTFSAPPILEESPQNQEVDPEILSPNEDGIIDEDLQKGLSDVEQEFLQRRRHEALNKIKEDDGEKILSPYEQAIQTMDRKEPRFIGEAKRFIKEFAKRRELENAVNQPGFQPRQPSVSSRKGRRLPIPIDPHYVKSYFRGVRLYAFLNQTEDEPSNFLPMPTFIPDRDADESPPASLYRVGETDWARDCDSLDGVSFKDFDGPFLSQKDFSKSLKDRNGLSLRRASTDLKQPMNPASREKPSLTRSATFSLGQNTTQESTTTANTPRVSKPKVKKGFFRKFW
ncbi:hypothetical protein EDC01DRAFT_434596 [Geopyxis carbonaria]|nr:hypothetical protein EDC01DRAFT_434596 [Geopyxis carbonaria]